MGFTRLAVVGIVVVTEAAEPAGIVAEAVFGACCYYCP